MRKKHVCIGFRTLSCFRYSLGFLEFIFLDKGGSSVPLVQGKISKQPGVCSSRLGFGLGGVAILRSSYVSLGIEPQGKLAEPWEAVMDVHVEGRCGNPSAWTGVGALCKNRWDVGHI
jgi:hypothetical protein